MRLPRWLVVWQLAVPILAAFFFAVGWLDSFWLALTALAYAVLVAVQLLQARRAKAEERP